jgi:hypothetical protein
MAYFKIQSQFHFTETNEKNNLRNHDFIFIIILNGVRLSPLGTYFTRPRKQTMVTVEQLVE